MTKRNGGEPVTGKGIGIFINDSGVDGTHSDIMYGAHLVQNVMASINLNSILTFAPPVYLEDIPNTDTNSGHGTHVTGSAGGTGAMSGGKYTGAPNPFKNGTTFNYTLPEDAWVNLEIFDKGGNKITTLVSAYQQKGAHQASFKKIDLDPGLYIARIKTGGFSETFRMIAK